MASKTKQVLNVRENVASTSNATVALSIKAYNLKLLAYSSNAVVFYKVYHDDFSHTFLLFFFWL